jgi:hypothetical protein
VTATGEEAGRGERDQAAAGHCEQPAIVMTLR